MLILKSVLFLTIIIINLVVAKDVVELTDSDFIENIAKWDTALVMFYAPWCTHCKALKPEFAEAARVLHQDQPPIILAKVDCTSAGTSICIQYSIKGYPTLKVFHGGQLLDEYEGAREYHSIVKTMRLYARPLYIECQTLDDLKEVLNTSDHVIMGLFKANTSLNATFQKLIVKLRFKYKFAYTSDFNLLNFYNVTNNIILFRPKFLQSKFESSFVVYNGKADIQEVIQWINVNKHGLCGYRTIENQEEFKPPLVVVYYNVDFVRNLKGTCYWRNRILKVAKPFTNNYTFAISNISEFINELEQFGEYFESTPDKKYLQPIACAWNAKREKYKMTDTFSVESFNIFLLKLSTNKLKPYIRSAPEPTENSGPVEIAVASNFDLIVTENSQDTFILFYAPWCEHCKRLEPIFEELANMMRLEHISFVKFDATENDVPLKFEVTGFPTLYWIFKDRSIAPTRYQGQRTLKDLLEYVASQATKELIGYDRKGIQRRTELK